MNPIQWTSKEKKIRKVFFNLIQKNQGSITVMDLAIAANISGTDAKKYLNQFAVEFDATFDNTEQGHIVYLFPIRNNSNQTKQKSKNTNNNATDPNKKQQEAADSSKDERQSDANIKVDFEDIEKKFKKMGQSLNDLFKF